ncbi:MAG: class I SAM-dependent methyltransferase [Bacteroidetes bacterium]|nr:MAG: class I SAM-dependent methyltransferase [Bacteroidota bacterium]
MIAKQPSIAFSGDIPAFYHTHLGPLFFEPYAADMASRIRKQGPQKVLEIACGTGILTRQLANELPEGSHLVATDLNPSMLDYASALLSQTPAISWDIADAVDLSYPDNTFDCVASQFGAMFYSDRPRAYAEALRVLKPGGTFYMLTWDSMEKNPVSRIAHQTLESFFPFDTPGFFRVPWAYYEESLIRAELKAGGFEQIEHIPLAFSGKATSSLSVAKGLMRGTPVHPAILERDASLLEPIQRELSARIAAQFGDQQLEIPLQASLYVATK